MLTLRSQLGLGKNFPGAVHPEGHPTGPRLPEIVIERDWGLKDQGSGEFSEYFGPIGGIPLLRNYKTGEEMRRAVKEKIVRDLSWLFGLHSEERDQWLTQADVFSLPPFSYSKNLSYVVCANSDNQSPGSQDRFLVLTIDEAVLTRCVSVMDMRILLGGVHFDEKKLDEVLNRCFPRLEPAGPGQGQQMELF